MLLLEEVVADEERPQVAREVLVAGDGVSGDAREGQGVEALPDDLLGANKLGIDSQPPDFGSGKIPIEFVDDQASRVLPRVAGDSDEARWFCAERAVKAWVVITSRIEGEIFVVMIVTA